MTTGNDKAKQNGIKQYEKAVAKYADRAPITERMKATAKTARKAQGRKRIVGKTAEQPILKRKAIGGLATKAKEIFKSRKTYDVQYMLFSRENRSGAKRPACKIDGVTYYPLMLLNRSSAGYAAHANVKANEFIETLVSRRIRKYHKTEGHLYKKVFMRMNTSSEFRNLREVREYAEVIRIESVEMVETDTGDYDEKDQPLKQAQNINTYYRYIQTEVDGDAETTKKALQKKNHRENECWINALLENFEGIELTKVKRPQKNVKTLTREKVLGMLEMGEEEFVNNGASINQMDKVFKILNIPVRLYNFTGAMIYEDNPPNYEKGRVKVFRGLVKNNHIYLVNNDLDTLKHIQPKENFNAFATSKFYITDRTEPVEYKMFENIDELLKMTDKEEYSPIHSRTI